MNLLLLPNFPLWWYGAAIVVLGLLYATPARSVSLFIVGLFILAQGAEWLTGGAVHIAKRLGWPTFVIGLTVVAIGTSMPEVAASFKSALDGAPGVAIGNVVGSNIANPLLVLGLSACVLMLFVSRETLRIDMPVMLVSSAALLVMGLDGVISITEGIFLLLGLVLYLVILFLNPRGDQGEGAEELTTLGDGWGLNMLGLVMGIGGLWLGADLMLDSAILWGKAAGWSDELIGVSIVALGTSLPEIVISLKNVMRGERDLVVGNVVGSNIFNVLLVVSAASFGTMGENPGIPVISSSLFDIGIMLGLGILTWTLMITGKRVTAREGFVLVGLYSVYLGIRIGEQTGGGILSIVLISAVLVSTLFIVGIVFRRMRRRVEAKQASAPAS